VRKGVKTTLSIPKTGPVQLISGEVYQHLAPAVPCVGGRQARCWFIRGLGQCSFNLTSGHLIRTPTSSFFFPRSLSTPVVWAFIRKGAQY